MRGYTDHFQSKRLFSVHLPLMIITISLALLGSSPAWAENLHIAITSPSPNSIFENSTVVVTGTWSDDNASSIPVLTVGATDQGLPAPTVYAGTWTQVISNLGGGWHTIEAQISDQLPNTGSSNTIQIMVITSHMSQPKDNVLFIQESATCEKLLQMNEDSGCPTLGDLARWDTSNQQIAGKIVEINGTWERTKEAVASWWNFVNQTGIPTVCVECDFDWSQNALAQIIWLEPHGFTFASPNAINEQNVTEWYWNGTEELSRVEQQPEQYTTLVINHDRYISSDCSTANLIYSPIMMADTIAYMDSNCEKPTHLILNSTLTIPPQPFDFAHSSYWREYNWDNNITETSLGDCITKTCDTPTDPDANPGFATGK